MQMENFENIRLPWRDWKIVKDLGGGTYGRVYEIERTISGIQEKAALKIVSRPKNKDEMESYYNEGYSKADLIASYESEIRNYVQEYKLMKELQGESNIVSCDDFAIEENPDGIGGKIYIRMELLTPLQKVTKERLLSEEEVIKLGKDICKALILCESRNIIHRDIKPDNVMISKFGDFKLGDFGVSKVMGHTTAGTMTGTEGYIAPEVLHMEKYGKEVDIYSLGIVMYWLLNNRRMPFIGADEKLTPSKVSEASLRRYHGDKIPAPKNGSARLKQIVLKACEYYPKDRFLTAQEMYDALIELKDEKSPSQSIREEETARMEALNSLQWILKERMISMQEKEKMETISIENPHKKIGADPTFIENPGDIGGYTEKKSWDVDGETLGNSWDDTAETIDKPKEKIERKPNAGQNIFQHSEVKNGFKVTMQDNFSMQEPEDFSSETIGIKNVKSKEKKAYSESDERYMRGFGNDLTWDSEWVLTQIEEKKKPETNKRFYFLESKEHKEKRLFDDWMKKSKEKLLPEHNIDNFIRLNPDFARRLYYEKCREKYLLDYMEKLNPEVVKEIRTLRE